MQEINHFQNVTAMDLKAFSRQHHTMAALLVRLDRAADISTRHAKIAEQLRLAARAMHETSGRTK